MYKTFLILSRNYSFADSMCFDFAKHKSSESSRSETFSLSKSKNRGTRPRFFGNCGAISIEWRADARMLVI